MYSVINGDTDAYVRTYIQLHGNLFTRVIKEQLGIHTAHRQVPSPHVPWSARQGAGDIAGTEQLQAW